MSLLSSPAFCSLVPLQPATANPQSSRTQSVASSCTRAQHDPPQSSPPSPSPSRRAFLVTLAYVALNGAALSQAATVVEPKLPPPLTDHQLRKRSEPIAEGRNMSTATDAAASTKDKANLLQFIQTENGVAYVDFEVGQGPKPKWGDIITLHYSLYTVAPSKTDLVKHATSYGNYKNGFVIHHGNGEAILGMEQMLHSMPVGAKRRFVLPQQLAYSKPGFIPIPPGAGARRKFAKALSDGDGSVVMDVEILAIEKDQDDRGFYTDLIPTDEEQKVLVPLERLKDEDLNPNIPSYHI